MFIESMSQRRRMVLPCAMFRSPTWTAEVHYANSPPSYHHNAAERELSSQRCDHPRFSRNRPATSPQPYRAGSFRREISHFELGRPCTRERRRQSKLPRSSGEFSMKTCRNATFLRLLNVPAIIESGVPRVDHGDHGETFARSPADTTSCIGRSRPVRDTSVFTSSRAGRLGAGRTCSAGMVGSLVRRPAPRWL